ncbi:hypothetical protein [Schlesneria sp. DSM 10557]|uniref:hypothetical protein n=1 Tax=Schlesneria sp. DSM 10557 TaxID=3044399 RepID=UPI0035A0C5E8
MLRKPNVTFPAYFVGLNPKRFTRLDEAIRAAEAFVTDTAQSVTIFVVEQWKQRRKPFRTIVDAESFWHDPHTTTTNGATE